MSLFKNFKKKFSFPKKFHTYIHTPDLNKFIFKSFHHPSTIFISEPLSNTLSTTLFSYIFAYIFKVPILPKAKHGVLAGPPQSTDFNIPRT